MYKRFMQWSRTVLGFSRLETRGYTAAIMILLGLSAGLQVVKKSGGSNAMEHPQATRILDSLFSELRAAEVQELEMLGTLRKFDPNTIAYDSLIQWGIPRRVAANLEKYRAAGGSFRYRQDLRKIYGMSDSLWASLKPYLELGEQPYGGGKAYGSKLSPVAKRIEVQAAPLDINRADTFQLRQIRGIGPVLSARIIKYRYLLGGYYSKDQFHEIYGLSPEVVQRLKEKVVINSDYTYHKILLNSFDYKELSRHPYITHAQAKAIIAYRDLHGPYQDLGSLKNLHLIDDSTYIKVYPYLDF